MHRHADGLFLTRHYKPVRKLGEGSFGRVDLVRERTTGQERVCKVVHTLGMKPTTLELMKKEVRILSQLDHPHIVKIHEYAEDKERDKLILILEYISGGTCADLLKREGGALGEPLVARLVRQLLVAVAYCHEHGVVHRDIKPENMMIVQSSATRSPDCKVIDFGLAASSGSSEDVEGLGEAEVTPRCPGWGKRVGTPAYMAPEAVDWRTACGSKADVWSVGVSCLELLTGVRLFQGDSVKATFAKIRGFRGAETLQAAVGRTSSWRRLSSGGRDFVRWLLQAEPAKRPSAAEALAHPWLVQGKIAACGPKGQVVQSLSSYARASPAVRDCLLAVAARAGPEDTRGLDKVFLSLDADGDGQVSWQELARSLAGAGGYGEDKVDVEGVVQAADAGSSGDISYTEFIAACLLTRFGSVRDLAARAFSVLDDDRDGKVSVADLHEAFPGSDCSFAASLPQDRPFSMDEWCECVQAANTGVSTSRASKLRLCVAGARVLSRAGGC